MGRHVKTKSTLKAVEAAMEEAIRLKKIAETRCVQMQAEVAHDIKNPLTAMMGHISFLQSEILGSLGDKRYMSSVLSLDKSAKRLLEICNTLLHEKDAEEKLVSGKKITRVSNVAGEIVDLFAVMAKERGVSLEADIPKNFPDINADPQEMYRVLSNLTSNAIKFTPKGGKVQILAEVDKDDNAFIMVVRDSGVGMTPEQIRDVLDMQATTVSPHGDVGTGHGLAIVNRIVREMGGRMEIVSSENRGTKVKLKFPYDLLNIPEPVTEVMDF
ncbi:MAG: HAMP domain-containing histidine kinase [Rhodospirillaceae bacterium]|nr:HAMP domain-containing histidine kinase [Rhodospirillaceae bacterium]